jgi:hypothetical protein
MDAPPVPQREPVAPPNVEVTIKPDEKGVDSLARQIKVTGRAYPLFDIAQMILQKPERQEVCIEVIKKGENQTVKALYLCALDDSIWLSEDEAVQHVLGKHFNTFYQSEKIPTEPPKGVYTFVAQCGMSGTVLGPPNYHDYQNQLRRLHADRFSRIQFDEFKSRVKIVKDEAVVKKWLEDQSFKTEYVALNVPEPVKLTSKEEVEKHFRETHLPNMIKAVDSHLLTGAVSREQPSPIIQRLIRQSWEDQKRFPIQVATILSQQFASRGLQFFKVNKTVTHVAVSRPHFLDMEATTVSDGVKKIVDYINSHPKTTRRKLLDALAPAAVAVPAAAPAAPGEAPAAPTMSPEQGVLNGDLHWLVHQGHVIEFANGVLETAKRPAPRPVKEQKPRDKQQPGAQSETVPNASVEEIAPATSEMEAIRPEGSASEASEQIPVEDQSPVVSKSELVTPATDLSKQEKPSNGDSAPAV